MPAAVAGRRVARTRLLARAGLGVAVAGPGWLLFRGVLPMNGGWVEIVTELAVRPLRNADASLGATAVLLDWAICSGVEWLMIALAAAQGILSLGLLLASLAALAGDEMGAWSLRRWAWSALVVDGLSLAATAGVDGTSWLRAGLAVAILRLVESPSWLRPEPLGEGTGPVSVGQGQVVVPEARRVPTS